MRLVAAVVATVAAIAIGSCWTQPKPPTNGSLVPGTTWITPPQSWRVTQPPNTILVESRKTALLGGAYGWVARLDLSTGLIVAEKRIGRLAIDDMIALPRGRILAIGTRRDDEGLRTEAMILDPATLDAKQITLASRSDKDGYQSGAAAVVSDGTIALSGPGLPLATYDPQTWEIVKVYDEEQSWSGVRASESAIIAYRSASVFRFDLKTGEKRSIGIGTQVAASKNHVAMRRYESGKWFVDLVDDKGAKRAFPTPVENFAMDRDGKWIVSATKSGVLVHGLADGKLAKRFELGPVRGVSLVEIAHDTIVVASTSLIRRIDLPTGDTSPAGQPPYGTAAHVAVADDGSVLVIGAEAWRLVDAAVVASAKLDSASVMYATAGETKRFGTVDDSEPDRSVATLRAIDSNTTLRRWTFEQDTLNGWLSANGEVAIELMFGDDVPGRLVRSDGARMVTLTDLHTDANVRDVDLDANVALVEMKGEVHVVKLGARAAHPQKQSLRAPRCEEYADATLERRGTRALTQDDRDVIVWDRATAKALGSIHLEESPNHVAFVPTREEILIVVNNGLTLWSPSKDELRTYATMAIQDAAVSPDGKRLALGLADGRVVLADYEATRAKMTAAGRPRAVKIPPRCNELDPFDVGSRYDDEPMHDEDPDDPCGGADPCAP